MKFFDFHTHIILKQLFDENVNVDAMISQDDVTTVPQLCTDLPFIIESQAHQSQLAEFQDEVVIGAVLYGAESHLATEVQPLVSFLKASARHKLSAQLLQKIASNEIKAFTDFTFNRTLLSYLNDPASFNILTKDSFNAPLPKNKVNVFFVIEGCHSLVDTFNEVKPGQSYSPDEILRNLDLILQKVKILAINPTHLQQSNLCNHAFAIQITKSEPFYPLENGLTDDGRKVIQGIFTRGICVDTKHMSFKSRADLRADIESGKFTNAQALVCTHTGFTGVPFKDWPGFISLKKPVGDVIYLEVAKTKQTKNSPAQPGAPSFNMSTINLFDEEIVWMVRHGGLIGLSLDRRILGYVGKFDVDPTGIREGEDLLVDKEYISKKEWAALGIKDNQIGKFIDEDDCETMQNIEDSTENGIPGRDEYFYDHVLLHIKHYFQVCVNAGITVEQAQSRITIGSDYDGLINPFINIQTVKDIPDLKKYIKMNLGFYLSSLKDSKKWAGQLNIDQFTEDLFYNNGFNFIKAFFNK